MSTHYALILPSDIIPSLRTAAVGSVAFNSLSPGFFMFTRSSSAEPKTLQPHIANSNAAIDLQHRTGPSESGDKSVIGNDLRIIGQGLKILGQGVLQIDGEIEGDVQAAEVIVGEQGKVAGMVVGQRVIVRGTVSGVICGRQIALQSTSHVEGDLHHLSLTVEQGAMFDGRSRRAANESDLIDTIQAKARG